MDPAFRSSTGLPRYLAAMYALLVVYACLHPFAGWAPSRLPLFEFLWAPWPRYYRVSDLVLNGLGFLPLGFLLVAALPNRWPVARRAALAVPACAALSLSLEVLQNTLPTRVSSNLDLAFNTLGALLGASFGAVFGDRLFAADGGLQRWRARRVIAGRAGDIGLSLLALWLFAQLAPGSLVFASGDLRKLLDLPTPLPFSPLDYLRLEAAITAAHLVAVGLMARALMREPRLLPVLALVLLALAVRSLGQVSFGGDGAALTWATPGCRAGIALGLPLALLSLALSRELAQALAAVLLLVATALVNLAPDNPYLLAELALRQAGHFLNFHGATQLVSSLWPFLALTHLSLSSSPYPRMRR